VENAVGVLHVGVGEHAKTCDEPGGVVFEEDDLLVWLFEPVCMPEAVGVSTFVANPFSSSLFMWFIFCQSFVFEDSMDSVMTDFNALFSKDLF